MTAPLSPHCAPATPRTITACNACLNSALLRPRRPLVASPHQPLRLGLPCSTLTHAVAPQPPAYLGDSFSCTPEVASHSYTACAPPIPACFPRPPADMRARRPLVCTARPPVPLPEPFPSCLVVLWARVLASRGLVSTGHELRPIRCCAAWATRWGWPSHTTFPSPTTRAHPAGMPGLETAGRG